jgi:hypothetical protein
VSELNQCDVPTQALIILLKEEAMKIFLYDGPIDAADIHNQAINNDLMFLEAWRKGLVPWSTAASVVFRVRQIQRANPVSRDGHRDSQIASGNVNSGLPAS